MRETTIFIAILAGTLVSFLIPLVLSQSTAAQSKAHARRRLAEARMNARLLRLNL